MSDTTEHALTFSDVVSAISGKGPGKSGWYNGICPAHADSTPSLGVKEGAHGTLAVKCQAGCSRPDVLAALEQKTGKKYRKQTKRPPADRGITLDLYADMKRLPKAMLEATGTLDYTYQGKPAVCHTYFDCAGKFSGVKLRLSADSHDTVWEKYTLPAPYGLTHLRLWIVSNARLLGDHGTR